VSQQQRPAWTGGSDEALVPLGRGDDPTPATERDGHPGDGAQPSGQPSPPTQDRPAEHARPATEPLPADRHPPIDRRERAEQAVAPGRGQPPPEASRDLVAGRPERAARAGRLAGVTSPASGRSTATAADFTPERYLRGQAAPTRAGWRRFVYWLTGRRMNLAQPGRAGRAPLIAGQAPVAGCVAVISRKTGSADHHHPDARPHLRLFARRPGGRPDGNDAGSLGYRVRRDRHHRDQPARRRAGIIRYADIRSTPARPRPA
jgi:hypothetical protein